MWVELRQVLLLPIQNHESKELVWSGLQPNSTLQTQLLMAATSGQVTVPGTLQSSGVHKLMMANRLSQQM